MCIISCEELKYKFFVFVDYLVAFKYGVPGCENAVV